LKSQKRNRIATAVLGISFFTWSVLAANGSMAIPDLPVSPPQASEVNQDKLLEIASKFETKYGSETLSNDAKNLGAANREGFISVAIEPQTDRVSLYWAGKPSPDLQRSIASDKKIDLKFGLYSLEFMHNSGIKIISEVSTIPELAGLRFELFKPRLDGSGVDIELSKGVDSPSALSVESIEALLSKEYKIDVNVQIRESGNGINFTASRQVDRPVFSSGNLEWSHDPVHLQHRDKISNLASQVKRIYLNSAN
jgi:hypothetical protein